MKVSVLIPTLNAGELWKAVLNGIASQSFPIDRKIVVDSGSGDNTVELAETHGFEVMKINKSEFNHGKTRQQLVDLSDDTDVCVFLTQDAILASPDSIASIVAVFHDEHVGMAYGRQLPHENARPLEIHARLYNYPDQSAVLSIADQKTLGFKAFFCSDSFSAYRKSALLAVGGFPLDVIMGEDAIVAAKMLKAGYKKAYVANATVHHSHSYSLVEEFKRYFDTRVFHEQNIWMINEYGKPTGEGIKFVKSEIKYAMQYAPGNILKSVTSIFAKWMGYNSARFYKKLPITIVRKLSMHRSYWK